MAVVKVVAVVVIFVVVLVVGALVVVVVMVVVVLVVKVVFPVSLSRLGTLKIHMKTIGKWYTFCYGKTNRLSYLCFKNFPTSTFCISYKEDIC